MGMFIQFAESPEQDPIVFFCLRITKMLLGSFIDLFNVFPRAEGVNNFV